MTDSPDSPDAILALASEMESSLKHHLTSIEKAQEENRFKRSKNNMDTLVNKVNGELGILKNDLSQEFRNSSSRWAISEQNISSFINEASDGVKDLDLVNEQSKNLTRDVTTTKTVYKSLMAALRSNTKAVNDQTLVMQTALERLNDIKNGNDAIRDGNDAIRDGNNAIRNGIDKIAKEIKNGNDKIVKLLDELVKK